MNLQEPACLGLEELYRKRLRLYTNRYLFTLTTKQLLPEKPAFFPEVKQ